MVRTLVLPLVVVIAVFLAGFWFVTSAVDPGVEEPELPGETSTQSMKDGTASVAGNDVESAGFVETLAKELKDKFGDRIDEITIQARLYDVREDVVDRFPDNGRGYFREAVEIAFPDRAEAILELLARLERYREWRMTQNKTLMEMSPVARNGMLWQKRREIFGDRADILWADEREELMEKRQSVQDTLKRLSDADELTLQETLHQLNTALDETFDEDMRHLVDESGTVTKMFFSLDAVQDKLKDLPPDERQARIDEVRREMGFSEEAVERMRERDQEREKRWQKGNEYMQEREAIVNRYEGEARKQRLNELRSEYFEHEAPTIRKEEQNGFFRYERPRVYGRN